MRKFVIVILLATACSCFKKSAPESKSSAQFKTEQAATSSLDRGRKAFLVTRDRMQKTATAHQKIRAQMKPNTKFKTASASVTCDGRFHWVDVPGDKCVDGSQTGFEYYCPPGNDATSPLVVWVGGNGACWQGDGCDCQPDPMTGICTNPVSTVFRSVFGQSQSDDGLTLAASSFSTGSFAGGPVAAIIGPNTPFVDFNIVAAANCGGDEWSGSIASKKLKKSNNMNITVNFAGFASMGAMISKIQSFFPDPGTNALQAKQFALWSDSSSGFGIDCSLNRFRNTWPSSNLYSMNDAGPDFFVQSVEIGLIPDVTTTWGFASIDVFGHVSSRTCPLDPSMKDPAQFLYSVPSFNRRFIPSVRKSYSDDYADATLTFFAELIGLAPGTSYTDGLVPGFTSVIVRNNVTDDTAQKPYLTALTNNDTQNFGIMNIPLSAGQTIDVGTCITSGSSNTGQNVLRLLNPLGVQVAIDSASCPGGGAHINYVVPALATGQYTLRLGCVADTLCGGTVASHTTGPVGITFSPLAAPAPYSASNTATDTQNFKTAPVYLVEGQTIDLGTCGVDNSIAIGDTFLKLVDPSNVVVASANNGCPAPSLGSRLQYTVPLGGRGLYTIRQGCNDAASCGGFTAYWIIGPTLYKSYIHTGTCHSERQLDSGPEPTCDYNVMTQAGTMFNDWTKGWMEINPANWINVQ